MDSEPATTTGTSATPDEAWRRFTLLDLLVLFSGHEAALGVMKWNGALESGFTELLSGRFLLLFTFLMLGAGISLPLIYLIQLFSRRRCKGLSYGEVLGISSILFWGATFCGLMNSLPEALGWLIIGCMFTLYCAGAVTFSIKRILKRRRNAPCRWLDLYGYFLSIVSLGISVCAVILMTIYGR